MVESLDKNRQAGEAQAPDLAQDAETNGEATFGGGDMTSRTKAKDVGGRVPAVHEVEIDAYAILGTASMPVSQLLRMGRGAVVELDTGLGDQIDIKVNDVLVARGEIVVVQDRVAVEITEVIKRDQD